MTKQEYAEFLKNNNVTVVHFSHHQRMSHDVEYPDDLNHAIKHYKTEIRSCCAICPTHQMDLPGSVGIIFKPELENIVSVCNFDSGSSDFGSLGDAPSENSLRESLNVAPYTYNEWVIKGAEPKGIFIANVGEILVKKAQKIIFYGEEQLIFGNVPISVQDVKNNFSKVPVFTMGKNGLIAV